MTDKQERGEEILKEALPLLKTRFALTEEISRLTKEALEMAGENDLVSVRMILKMRGKAMVKVDDTDQKLNRLKEADQSGSLKRALEGTAAGNPDPLEARIGKLAGGSKKALKEALLTDRHLSRKLAGERSVYKER